jgi:PBP1b-binding outer membrane lipoprotein LpoB
MKKILLIIAIAMILVSCSAPKRGYDYNHHHKRQQVMYKQTKRVNKGKSPLHHQCSPKKRR